MTSPDLDYWRTHRDALQEMIGRCVGFPVEVYRASSVLTGVGKKDSYQIMPTLDGERARRVFWAWHLDHNRQFFPTPLEAAAAFVRSWRRWVREAPNGLRPT
jgi:hypothetical protein